MFVVGGGRRSGKTSFLIWKSAFMGIPIVVLTDAQKQCVEVQARNMGVEIPTPIVWRKTHFREGYRTEKVLIDESQHWINHVLREYNFEAEGMAGQFTVGEMHPHIYKIDKTDNVTTLDNDKWITAQAAMYGNFVQKKWGVDDEKK